MLRCYERNNIDTSVNVKRIRAIEIKDYAAFKLMLKREFPQYFGNLILDFSANVQKQYVKQCISDTYNFFEEFKVLKCTRSALIGITTAEYNFYLAKLGIIDYGDLRKPRIRAGFNIFDMLESGMTVYDIAYKQGCRVSYVYAHYSVWQKKGENCKKSEARYLKTYNLWTIHKLQESKND